MAVFGIQGLEVIIVYISYLRVKIPLRGTRPDIITLLVLSSLTDPDRFIISAAISLVPRWMLIFSGFLSMIGLVCHCIFSILWKISLQLSVYHLRVPIPFSPWPLNCPKWQLRHISLLCFFMTMDYLICGFYPCVIIIFSTWIGFVWVASFRWF